MGRRTLITLALVLTVGCNQPGQWQWQFGPGPSEVAEPRPSEAGAPPAVPAAEIMTDPSQDPVGVTTFTFDVMQVRGPQGLFSESGKLWNHLDAGFLPAEDTAFLHRNGLRVARADAEAWPPIRAILETEPHVQTAQTRLTMSNGLPLLLELDRDPRDQILFLYRRDGTLAGAPWRGSTNALRIEYGILPTDARSVLLEICPELRLDLPAAQTLRGGEQWSPHPAPPRSRIIRELAFRVQLAPGQFAAIGPSSATRELPYIMGALLLCEEQEGEMFESIYFITPTLSRTAN